MSIDDIRDEFQQQSPDCWENADVSRLESNEIARIPAGGLVNYIVVKRQGESSKYSYAVTLLMCDYDVEASHEDTLQEVIDTVAFLRRALR